MPRAPVLFLSHGAGPAFLIDYTGSRFQDADKNSPAAEFLRNLPKFLEMQEVKFQKILMISAHWEEQLFSVDYREPGDSRLYYDYSGFPVETYAPMLTYPIQSDTSLASRTYQLISRAGLKAELRKREEGYDHGTFIPLKAAFPDAPYPIVQVSLRHDLDIAAHIKLGEALAPLRDEGVMIICSGQITHGGRDPSLKPGELSQKSLSFVDWISKTIETSNPADYDQKKAQLLHIRQLAPFFDENHPRIEHLLPLMVAFGAGASLTGTDVPPPGNEGISPSDTVQVQRRVEIKRVFQGLAFGYMGLDNYMFHDTNIG